MWLEKKKQVLKTKDNTKFFHSKNNGMCYYCLEQADFSQ